MKLSEYQEFCSRGVLPATLEREPAVGFALGLAGETGEVVDDIKKKYFHGRDIDDNHTIEELGDVMWYVANLATQYGVTLDEIITRNRDKLLKRYPDMYEGKMVCRPCGPHVAAYTADGKFIKFLNKKEKEELKNECPWD